MIDFNINIYSKYRTELMGVATLLIIICHAPAYNVIMPQWLSTILSNGGFGVDIFLFLSGMGIYNSYMSNLKKGNVFYWLFKRYMRIIIPYILIVLPLFIWNPWNINRNIISYIIELSGFGAIGEHSPLWFISCILVLYILTPILSLLLKNKYKWIWLAVLSIACFFYAYSPSHRNIWHFMMQRWPSYFLGFALSPYIKKGEKHSAWYFIILPLILYTVLYILNHKANTHFSLFWLQGISIMTVSVLIINTLNNNKLNSLLAFMGIISLESYITNEYLLRALATFPWTINGYDINPGNWSFYIGGTIICLIISKIANETSHKLTKFI